MTELQPPEPFAIPDCATPATLFQVLVASACRQRHKTAFVYLAGEEECQVTYGKLFEDVLLLARSFHRRGIAKGDRVVLLSDNRYDWIVSDLAIMAIGAVSVPRGTDTPRQELEYIVEQSGSSYLIVETGDLLALHDDYIKGCRQLKGVFVISAPELHTLFSHVYSYTDLLADRRFTDDDVHRFLQRGEAIAADDLLTVIYTSGTTGQPKGVMLSHANIAVDPADLAHLRTDRRVPQHRQRVDHRLLDGQAFRPGSREIPANAGRHRAAGVGIAVLAGAGRRAGWPAGCLPPLSGCRRPIAATAAVIWGAFRFMPPSRGGGS